MKNDCNKLIEKFNNPQDFDKLCQAQANIDSLKSDVGESIHKLTVNQEELNDLETQTFEMQQIAGQFNKNSKSLERQFFWKKTKYTIFIIGIAIVILLIVILSIALN